MRKLTQLWPGLLKKNKNDRDKHTGVLTQQKDNSRRPDVFENEEEQPLLVDEDQMKELE